MTRTKTKPTPTTYVIPARLSEVIEGCNGDPELVLTDEHDRVIATIPTDEGAVRELAVGMRAVVTVELFPEAGEGGQGDAR